MSTTLIYALVAAGVVLLGLLALVLKRRGSGPAEPPPATRAQAPAAKQSQHAEGMKHGHAYDTGEFAHSSGIQVDELHVGDDELLSTAERHIGDTQPVDRGSLNLPPARKRKTNDANGGKTVASEKNGDDKGR